MNINKSVLVTGASSGIGWDCALELDRMGWTVFAGVRKEEDGRKLGDASSGNIIPVVMDIVDYESVKQAAVIIGDELNGAGLDALVNNAGISVQGPLEFVPIEMFEKQMQVNVNGHVAVTQNFLPLIRQAKGRIVFISSESGRFTLPLVGPYSASKFALEAVATAFRRELLPSGIRVSLVEPASVKTPIWEKAQTSSIQFFESVSKQAKEIYAFEFNALMKMPKMLDKSAIPVEKVTRAVIHALTAKKPKIRYVVGLEAWFLIIFYAFTPTRISDWITSRMIKLIGRQ
ncbi:MAG: SDR family NAD(P)-dependent oxidoreductase [Desulfobacterales bacterium]|nr:SDR family NAD(P)-dependent oxidoreductase [Desulfobacterales bacterium]